jgi:hypothetical protein
MMIRYAAALCLAAAAAPAQATDWYMIGESADQLNMIFVDKDSISGSGDRRQAMTYMVFAEDDEGAAAVESRIEFDCQRPRLRLLSLRAFDAADRMLFETERSDDWDDVDPDSGAPPVHAFVCSGGGSLPVSASRGSVHPFAEARRALRETPPRQ